MLVFEATFENYFSYGHTGIMQKCHGMLHSIVVEHSIEAHIKCAIECPRKIVVAIAEGIYHF